MKEMPRVRIRSIASWRVILSILLALHISLTRITPFTAHRFEATPVCLILDVSNAQVTLMLTMYCSNLNSIIMIGGNFNYGRDPGWKLPGRPIMNPGGTTKGIIIVHIFTTYTNQSLKYGFVLSLIFRIFIEPTTVSSLSSSTRLAATSNSTTTSLTSTTTALATTTTTGE